MRNPSPMAYIIALCGGSLLLAGCATQPSGNGDMYDRQEQALRRPFDSSPGHDIPDISGGDIGSWDQKAMNRDVDHVLNP